MKGLNPHTYIHIGLWNQIESDDRIFYTNAPEKAGSHSKLVTIFNPRWAFVPLTLSTAQIWKDLPASQLDGVAEYAPEARDLISFLLQAKAANFNKVWIYAELEELGELLAQQAAGVFPDQRLFFWAEGSGRLPAFETARPEDNVLRLFVFGGPLSSYLLRKKNRYLPLALSGGANQPTSLAAKMRLFVSGSAQSIAALDKYHDALYSSSLRSHNETIADDACPPFFTVYRAYDELAWLLQHRSSFKDADEFGLCLKQHHSSAGAP
jgi:hypothetical protein